VKSNSDYKALRKTAATLSTISVKTGKARIEQNIAASPQDLTKNPHVAAAAVAGRWSTGRAPAATAADAEKPATKTTPVSEQEKDRNDRQWPAIVAREANKAGLNVTPSGIKASG
jgi:hypothetical protein